MDHLLSFNMVDDINAFLELEALHNHEDPDHCPDASSSSETTRPIVSSFDMAFVSDFNSLDNSFYPSPISSARETPSPQPASSDQQAASSSKPKPPAKRKRENRYKNAPPSVLFRRRAQNRASQRAYRERKDQRIKDLEVFLLEQKQKNDSLKQAYSALHSEYLKVQDAQEAAAAAGGAPHMSRQQTATAPPMAFDAPAPNISMPSHHIGVMNYTDSMYMFQDMQPFNL